MKFFDDRSRSPGSSATSGPAGVDGHGLLLRERPVQPGDRHGACERTGIGVYYLSPLDDVAEGKRIIAGRALCCGVINDIKLIDWTPEQVRHEVRRIIEAGKPGGKFLFGTLVMPLDIPDENIRAMLDAAYEYGRLDVGCAGV